MQDCAVTAAFYEDLGRDDLTDRNAVVAGLFTTSHAAAFLRGADAHGAVAFLRDARRAVGATTAPLRPVLERIVAGVERRDVLEVARALAEYARFLVDHNPQSRPALGVYGLILRSLPEDVAGAERADWLGAAAKVAVRTGSHELASALIDELRDSAAMRAAPSAAVSALFLEAELRMNTGDLPAAERLLRDALRRSREASSRGSEAVALYLLGCTTGRRYRYTRAAHLFFAAYRLAPQPDLRIAALIGLAQAMSDLGQPRVALAAQEQILRLGLKPLQRSAALVACIELAVRVGDRDRFTRFERQLAEMELEPYAYASVLQSSAHGYARFGDLPRARQLRATALRFAECAQLGQIIFELEAMDLDSPASPAPPALPSARQWRQLQQRLELEAAHAELVT